VLKGLFSGAHKAGRWDNVSTLLCSSLSLWLSVSLSLFFSLDSARSGVAPCSLGVILLLCRPTLYVCMSVLVWLYVHCEERVLNSAQIPASPSSPNAQGLNSPCEGHFADFILRIILSLQLWYDQSFWSPVCVIGKLALLSLLDCAFAESSQCILL